jgi:TonB family protein
LPSIIPQQYASAKAAFDRKDYVAAAAGFDHVLTVLADPDVIQVAGRPPLSDLKTLAAGFQELSAKAIPPPPLPVAAQPVPAAAPPPPAPPPAAPARPRVYMSDDDRVVAPVAIRQDLPSFQGRLPGPVTGALEVIINERGLVESSRIRESVNPAYDKIAVYATRNWRYTPATLNGEPVKFRKLIAITIKSTM